MLTQQVLRVIDSHTGGEPTRVVIDGVPELGALSMAEARLQLQQEHDALRKAIVCEPRGSDVLVGAYVFAPNAADCVAGVVFFNNVGYLGMCGHGMIGLVKSLQWLGRIRPGLLRFETPVGEVQALLHEDGRVSVANVASYRYRARVGVEVEGFGLVHGDIAWGGNWFFLVGEHPCRLDLAHIDQCMEFTRKIRAALDAQGITGSQGAVIDHIELFSASETADARNFVLCPGLAYDRSPCGTGTSAKLACLAADGMLAPGVTWRQESVIGSVFDAHYEQRDGETYPVITGTAFVTADAQLIVQSDDPFAYGI